MAGNSGKGTKQIESCDCKQGEKRELIFFWYILYGHCFEQYYKYHEMGGQVGQSPYTCLWAEVSASRRMEGVDGCAVFPVG